MDARVTDERPHRSATPGKARGRRLLRALRMAATLALPILLLAGAATTFGYLRATRPAVPVERQTERPRAVQAVVAAPADVRPTLTVYGTIVAGRSVDLRALVPGTVVAVSGDLVEGGRVAAGAELLRIDPFAYEGALVRARADIAETRGRIAEIEARTRQEQAAIASAREQLDITRRELDRLAQLRESGAASVRAYDDARLRVSQAQGALETRENQLAVYEAQRAQLAAAIERLDFALRQAERNLADTVLRAPFDALVSDIGVEEGKIVGQNDRVATLIATERLEARFALSDAQYSRLAATGELIGRPVTVLWQAGETQIAREAHIARVAARSRDAAFDVHAVFAEGAVPDLLRPGAFVEARLADRAYADAMILPTAALYDGFVFVIDAESRLRRAPAEVLAYGEEGAVVRAPVPAGAMVLVSRLGAPAEGQLVEVRP